MRRQILALTSLHLAVVATLVGAAWHAGVIGAASPAAVGFAIAIAIVGSVRMNVELGRHACSVTLVEAVVVAMLLHLTPAGVLAAAVLGEILACAWQRQAPSKLLYNACSAATAAIVAALAFDLLRANGTADGGTWVAALVAGCCYATSTHASTSAVLAVVEDARFSDVFAASLVPVAIASVISATIGLVAVVLASVTPGALILVAPLVLVMVAETRRLAIQRAEQLRFERLYAASSRTGGLTSLPAVMATLAEEARSLVTGAAGMCCTRDAEGAWTGLVVDEDGVVPAGATAVEALLRLGVDGQGCEFAVQHIPVSVRSLSPGTESLVVARSDGEAAAPVVLAVFRALAGDDGAGARAGVLAAFIGHAALTIANARLYADVEAALAHQVDLNRQKDDFVSAVSHELRTPLAAMIGSIMTLRRLDDRLKAEQRSSLLDISFRQGKRLQHLIEELLTLATVDNGEPFRLDEPVHVATMVDEIADELRRQRNDVDMPPVRFADGGVGTVYSAEQKFRQVVSNLIENACKYAPGSPIDIVVEKGSGETARLKVIDAGPGIAPADRERVFERFVQLDQSSTRAQGGTGLGLYLCRQMARALGGSLDLTEALGGGCCFTLTVPHAAAPAPVADHHPEAGPPVSVATIAGGAA